MRPLIPYDARAGYDAARVAMFYAHRRDWQPTTQTILLGVANWLWAEAEARDGKGGKA